MRRLRHRLEAMAFRTLSALAGILPRRLLLAAGSLAGRLGYLLDRRHRRIALDNLDRAMPELGPRRQRRVVKDCWRHFGRITFDTFAFHKFGPDSVDRIVHYRGLENIRAAYAQGRGVLLFSGHFGHWEMTALMQGFLGLPLALVTRPLDNPYLEKLLRDLRTLSGNTIIYKRRAIREMLQTLRSAGGVAIVLDQDARSDGVFVPFFGRPASTTPTLALLALRSGAAVVPTYSIPRPDGSYLVVYEPEIEIAASGDFEADVRRVTALCTTKLEGWIRFRPELWLWMHRRWKTVPAGGSQQQAAGEETISR